MYQHCLTVVLLFGAATLFAVTPWSVRSVELQTDPEQKIDFSGIKRVDKRLYLDISVIVTYEALKVLANLTIDPETLLKKIFKEVAKMYAWHNIEFAVREVEYWSSGNKVRFPYPSRPYFLEGFFRNRGKLYDSHLIFHEFEVKDYVGFAVVDHLCTSLAIVLLKTSIHAKKPDIFAVTVAHELGHTIGLSHSNNRTECHCVHTDKNQCIMNRKNSEQNTYTTKSFENCSIDQITRSLSRHTCLLKPMEEERLFPSCGDGIIDSGEECDCGFPELCYNITDHGKYCDMDRCKYRKRDCQCIEGECCENCKYVFGRVCRPSHGECDVEERCNGKQQDCPKDLVVKSFALCDEDAGICYDGTCTNFNSLCKYVYKKETVTFSQVCVDNLKKIMNSSCIYDEYYYHYDLICNQFPNVCQHFVCESADFSLDYIATYEIVNEICFVPLIEIREGVLQWAPNYMKCGHDAYCFNGQCLANNSLLKNCKNGKCISIDNRRTVTDYKSLDLPPEVHSYRLFGYDEFVNETFSKGVVTASQNYKPLAWVVVAPIAVIMAVFGFVWWKRTRRKASNS